MVHVHGLACRQLFVAVGVAKVLLESSPTVVRSFQNARAQILAIFYNTVVIVILQPKHEVKEVSRVAKGE